MIDIKKDKKVIMNYVLNIEQEIKVKKDTDGINIIEVIIKEVFFIII